MYRHRDRPPPPAPPPPPPHHHHHHHHHHPHHHHHHHHHHHPNHHQMIYKMKAFMFHSPCFSYLFQTAKFIMSKELMDSDVN